jgi:two-component system, chemotaxis family, sensor kinase Cph1
VYEGIKGKVDPATLDLVDRSKWSMDKAQTLVQDLLALSRATKEGRPFQKVELSKVVYRALTNLDQEIREKRAKVFIDSSETLIADEAQLEQLIQNLISNALKYQPPGQEPEIHIKSACIDHIYCQFEIRDNGIGIPPEQSERIFEPFERLHGKSSQYEGTGVGLAICKRIIERHAGTIRVESEPGQGSRFVVQLPYRPQEASHPEAVVRHSEQ